MVGGWSWKSSGVWPAGSLCRGGRQRAWPPGCWRWLAGRRHAGVARRGPAPMGGQLSLVAVARVGGGVMAPGAMVPGWPGARSATAGPVLRVSGARWWQATPGSVGCRGPSIAPWLLPALGFDGATAAVVPVGSTSMARPDATSGGGRCHQCGHRVTVSTCCSGVAHPRGTNPLVRTPVTPGWCRRWGPVGSSGWPPWTSVSPAHGSLGAHTGPSPHGSGRPDTPGPRGGDVTVRTHTAPQLTAGGSDPPPHGSRMRGPLPGAHLSGHATAVTTLTRPAI